MWNSERTMDRESVLAAAADWMRRRGWRTKLAKKARYEQSLFEHSFIELDVLLELLPILSRSEHYGLSESEQQILAVAVVSHDVGKETGEWQAYVAGQGPWTPHVLPDLTSRAVKDICNALDVQVGPQVEEVIGHCAAFHHNKPGRSDGAIFQAILSGGTDRFLALAHIVMGLDHFCSAGSAQDAVRTLRDDPAFGCHLVVSAHRLTLRGVSSALLHRAALSAFEANHWHPLLYFPDATVYAADALVSPSRPDLSSIRAHLRGLIEKVLERSLAPFVVGTPTGDALPKPELVSFDRVTDYLRVASQKIAPTSFGRKKSDDKRKTVERYLRLIGFTGDVSDEQIELHASRISKAQPEIMVFRVFKGLLDKRKVNSITDTAAARAEELYNELFGDDAWKSLQSLSTLMPHKDMTLVIDRYWGIGGTQVSHPEVQSVGELPDDVRMECLIKLLSSIVQTVASECGIKAPLDFQVNAMTDSFLADLLEPEEVRDICAIVNEQLEHYAKSKPFAGKDSAKAVYLCPICNQHFGPAESKKSSADFVDKPESHTNRAVSHGAFSTIMICRACYCERMLLHILLGERPREIITILPHHNLGPRRGASLIHGIKTWIEKSQQVMRGDAGKVDEGFSLSFTEETGKHVLDSDILSISPQDLVSLFSYRYSADKQRDRRNKALSRLKQEFDNDLNAVITACGIAFGSWEEALNALVDDSVDIQEFKQIRREVFSAEETIQLVSETPNLIFVPLTRAIATSNESEATTGLRRLFVCLVLSLVFDASVATRRVDEPMVTIEHLGAAYVPSIPTLRSLIGEQWISLDKAIAWLRAIGAASQLVSVTGFPVRNALFQVLSCDPAEALARRIDMAGESRLSMHHLRFIRELPFFRGSREEALL